MFAAYWFKALDWGYATTDSTLAKTLYLPQCSDCARFMRTFDEAKQKGQHFQGGRLGLGMRQLISNDSRHPGTTVVDVLLSQATLKTIDAGGTSLGTDGAVRSIRYRTWLAWNATGWKVLDYKRVIER